jgi:hypothetical protein
MILKFDIPYFNSGVILMGSSVCVALVPNCFTGVQCIYKRISTHICIEAYAEYFIYLHPLKWSYITETWTR